MSLKNSVGMPTRVCFTYLDDKGGKQLAQPAPPTEYFPVEQGQDVVHLGEVKTVDPGDLNVPDGSTVFMYASVMWGMNNEASRGFIYQKGNPRVANYEISSTYQQLPKNDLVLIGIS
jgi:hypothetical protein